LLFNKIACVHFIFPGLTSRMSDKLRSLERNHKFRIVSGFDKGSSSSSSSSPPPLPLPLHHHHLLHHQQQQQLPPPCSNRHAFPHCASCPLAAHNKDNLRAIGGNTVLLVPRGDFFMTAPPPPEPNRGGLVSRPDNGWLHSENKLAREGISYLVKVSFKRKFIIVSFNCVKPIHMFFFMVRRQ
jgi:hypothetical protein